MKKIEAFEDNGAIFVKDSAGISFNVGLAPAGVALVEVKEKSNIPELVAAGLTADDLIKLKHGGVL